MYRSTDGGATWTAAHRRPRTRDCRRDRGAASKCTVAPSDPRVVYAFIESTSSALYRSGDGGATWERRDDSQNMVWRPFYFARLVVDPIDPDRLFKPDLQPHRQRRRRPQLRGHVGRRSHGDWHDLWIDPTNPAHIVGGDDGGLWIS